MAALLRSGASGAQAWAILATTSSRREWAVAAREAATALEAGEPVESARNELGTAWPHAVWASAVSARTGAPLAALLDRVAEDAGARADASRARTAGEAGARSTRRILAWLPVGGVLLAQLLGADPIGVLTGTLGGRVSALLGLAFWVAALAWSRRILARPAGKR